MLSVLLLTNSEIIDIENINNLILNIESHSKKPDNVEIIIKVDNEASLKELDFLIKKSNYKTSIFPVILRNSIDVKYDSANYNSLYLHIHQNSELLILLKDSDRITLNNWDKDLIENSHNENNTLSFLTDDQNSVIIHTKIIDIIGGFGQSNNIYDWLSEVDCNLKKISNYNLKHSLETNFLKSKKSDAKSNIRSNTNLIQESIIRQAKSLALEITYQNRLSQIEKNLNSESISNSCRLIKKKFGSFNMVKIPLIRYFFSTNNYILRNNSIPFLDLISVMTMIKNKIPLTKNNIHPYWVKNANKWNIDDISYHNNSIETEFMKNAYSSLNCHLIKKYGIIRSTFYLMKKTIVSRLTGKL